MRYDTRWIVASACMAGALLATAPARAGVMDYLFGATEKSADASQRRIWRLDEFTTLQLVDRETGAAPNQHPAKITPQRLEHWLGTVRMPTAKGGGAQMLFAGFELSQLVDPLAEALANARPEDDVLLLSAARRNGEGAMPVPRAVTARLFVAGDALQFIVNDVRMDFYDRWRGTGSAPTFVYGSRQVTGPGRIASDLATTSRSGWLAFPLNAPEAPAAAAGPATDPRTAPAGAPRPPARGAAFYDEQERRLDALKRLRDKALITEAEFQQKRKEIIEGL